jgi:phosphoglycerate dehydrogenase-like enzyme
MPVALIPYALDGLDPSLEVHRWDLDGDVQQEVLDRVEFYVTPYSFQLDTITVAARMPRLRVLQALTAGVDHALPHVPAGITVCNARGVHDTATSELAVTLTLAAVNDVAGWVRNGDLGRWVRAWRPGLADRRVVVVGAGAIGSAIAARLRPFECEVTVVGRTARDGVLGIAELPELLPSTDVVVLIVPLTDHTRHLVDAAFLAALPDGALVVNVSRGPVVDTGALVAELQAGRLRAAMDVTDPEPLPEGHPLWSHALISPHVGGWADAFRPRAERLIREQIGRWVRGEPLANVVQR